MTDNDRQGVAENDARKARAIEFCISAKRHDELMAQAKRECGPDVSFEYYWQELVKAHLEKMFGKGEVFGVGRTF